MGCESISEFRFATTLAESLLNFADNPGGMTDTTSGIGCDHRLPV